MKNKEIVLIKLTFTIFAWWTVEAVIEVVRSIGRVVLALGTGVLVGVIGTRGAVVPS